MGSAHREKNGGAQRAAPLPVDRTEVRSASNGFEVFDEILGLLLGEPKPEERVVVVHDRPQVREAAVVVEAALAMGPKSLQRRGAVPAIGGALGLEVVDPDLLRRVQVPAWLGEQRRHMTRST